MANDRTRATEKLDLRKQYKYLYSPSAKSVELVDLPELLFLAIDDRVEGGVQPGESEDFASAFAAMYGPSIQIIHVGPYSEEPSTLELLNAYANEHGLEMRGRHHDFYLGDPRTAKPENLKTILRHPVRVPG